MSQKLADKVGKQLSSDFTVSVEPDHPFLYDAPDILAGGKGSLLAIFTPNSTELRSPNALLARLATCRLALPSHTKCVFLPKADDFSAEVMETFAYNFHLILEDKDYSKLSNIVLRNDPLLNQNIAPIAPTLRQLHLQRAGVLFRSSKKILEHDDLHEKKITHNQNKNLIKTLTSTGLYSPISLESWSHQKRNRVTTNIAVSKYILFNYSQFEELVLAVAAADKSGVAFRQIKSYCAAAIRSDFYMEGGQINAKGDLKSSLKILMADKVPSYRADPEKPLRVAAFTGWVVTRFHSSEEVESLAADVAQTVGDNWE